MRFNRAVGGLVLAAVLAALGAGCGGFSASPRISPGMFFLPGLGQGAPASQPEEALPSNSISGELVAQAR